MSGTATVSRSGLLARALVRAAGSPTSPLQPLTDEELLGLVHELQVHQIELEMQNEALLEAQVELSQAAAVFLHSYDGIIVCDGEACIVNVNPAFTRITGYTKAEVIGRNPSLLKSGLHEPEFFAAMWRSLLEKDFWSGEIVNRRKSGSVFSQQLSIAAVRDADGHILNFVGVFSDISVLKRHEAELARVANYDSLTGLPNRRLLADRFRLAMARARRTGKPLAVGYLDLDDFKQVNDEQGHEAGDQLLTAVTHNLVKAMRADDTVARLGGDEFALLMDLDSEPDLDAAIGRLVQAISLPVHINGAHWPVSASVGITLYPQDDADADTLLRHADQAMYVAKEQGGNRVHRFDPQQARQVTAVHELRSQLRLALQRQEFVLHFQPKVDLSNGHVFGAEALIRWQHPNRGLLPPSAFLAALDGSELEVPVGEWVIENVLRQIEVWQLQGLNLIASANIAPQHLLAPGFTERLTGLLARHSTVDPDQLELEILESAAMSDVSLAVQTLSECRDLGVRFSLDDFGTGYSSLALLRQLPIDVLKIDQSFVRDMLLDPNDLALVEAVVQLASTFGREVIAEGVETWEHCAALVSIGCLRGQGYAIARPMPADEMPAWVAQWQVDSRWAGLMA